MKVLLAGAGYVGAALCERLIERGTEVIVIKRTAAGAPKGARVELCDLSDGTPALNLPEDLDSIVYSLAADEHTDIAYRRAYVDALRNILGLLKKTPGFSGRFCFTSSTAVYAQNAGELVDESSPTEPVHFSGIRMLEAEALLRESGYETVAVRFGGIYGPSRTRFIDEVKSGKARRFAGPPQYTNRIHRDDCAAMIEHLLAAPRPERTYIGVDSEPAPRNEVVSWLAGRLGVPEPALGGDAPPEAMRGNKRCSNKKILQSGYVFRYPSYREGYDALLLKA